MRFLTSAARSFNRLLLTGCILSAPFAFTCASAQSMYVSDYLIVNLKDNIDKPYTVVATVESNDLLEVLEEAGNYIKVETTDGEVGWIAKQYLKSELPKKIIIEQLQDEITTLKNKLSSLKQYEALALNPDQIQQTVLDLQAQNNNLNSELNNLSQTNQSIEQELEKLRKLEIVSDENISLLDQYEQAKGDIASLKETIQQQQNRLNDAGQTAQHLSSLQAKYEELLFTAQNSESIAEERNLLRTKNDQNQLLISQLQNQVGELRSKQMIYWFLAGAAVFIVGMIFGKINVKKKKRLSLS